MKRSIFILVLGIQASFLYATTHFCIQPPQWQSEQSPLELALNSPPQSFGKTHFIVGHPLHTVAEKPVAATETPKPLSNTHVLFTPDNNVRAELLRLINQETEGIRVAVFIMTDPDIAQALFRAIKKGILVELITDASCLKERAHKINQLCDQGCSVHIYNPSYNKPNTNGIMHHKFALFKNNNGKSLTWTGSYNFTKMASNANQENALILEDKNVFKAFSKQFKLLKRRAYIYSQGGSSANS